MSSIFSNVHTTNTVLGIIGQINSQVGISKVNLDATLNNKYGVVPAEVPVNPLTLKYFGIGIGGAYMEEGLSSDEISPSIPYIPSASNTNLYEAIPVLIKIGTDLSDEERANYRMRVVDNTTVPGTIIYKYYLKVIDFTLAQAEGAIATKIDISTGEKSEYTPVLVDPTPPIIQSGDIDYRVEVSLSGLCTITGAEILSAIEVLYGGNKLKTLISEFGFFIGEDKEVTIGGVTYTEAIGAQLAIHRCMTVKDMSNEKAVLTTELALRNGSSVVSGTYLLD